MSKRVFWTLSILTIAAMLLAACGGGGAQTTPTSEAGGGIEVTEALTEAPEATEVMTEAPEATEAMTEEPEATEAMTEEPEATEATGAVSGEIDCMGAQQGDAVTMLYQWSGVEEEQLNNILQPLVDACGIDVQAEATRDQGLLDTRVKAGNPPDIAFWNVVQLNQYKDLLKSVPDLGVTDTSLPEFWSQLGTVDGKWLGFPVKADVKSIIWYSPANFEALGYEVPTSWEELDALVEKMVADGQVPWSMGLESEAATGWTGSDFIQDILLVQQGPQYVLDIINGKVPYNDVGVQQAYETYGKWATDPKYTVGGAEGTLTTGFRDAIFKIVTDPPEAMMVKQSGFAGGEIAGQYPDLVAGEDYDFFQVPGLKGVQGSADWMMAFSDKPAVKAIFTYLASDLGATNWGNEAFGLSPNPVGLAQYDETTPLGKLAGILSEAQGFTPDIGDTIPGGFGTAEWKAIIDYLNGTDLKTALDQAAKVQADATSSQ